MTQDVDVHALDPAHEADVLATRRGLARHAEEQAVVAAQADRGLPVVRPSDFQVGAAASSLARALRGAGPLDPGSCPIRTM